jgi:hypothetical protein
MSVVTRPASKLKFQTGDVPSEDDFIDLHDSVMWSMDSANSRDHASGNGTDDDATGLTTFFNLSKGLLFVDKGTYSVSVPIIINTVRTSLTIVFHPEAKIVPTSGWSTSAGSVMQITNADRVRIIKPRVEGNLAVTSLDNNVNGIKISGADYVKVSKGNFPNQPKGALLIEDCDDVHLDDNYAPDAYNFGFEVKRAKFVTAMRNHVTGRIAAYFAGTIGTAQINTCGLFFDDCTSVKAGFNKIEDYAGTGMKSDGGYETKFFANEVYRFGKDGLKIQGSTTRMPRNGIIGFNIAMYRRHAATDGSCYGMLEGCQTGIMEHNIFEGDGMDSHTGTEYGISIIAQPELGGVHTGSTVRRINVIGNCVTNVGTTGFYGKNMIDACIAHNTFTDCMMIASTTHGMWFQGTTERVDIIDAKIRNTAAPATSGAGTPKNGICIESGKDIVIREGHIQRVSGNGISIKMTAGTNDYIIIDDVEISDTSGGAVDMTTFGNASTTTTGMVTITRLRCNRNCLDSANYIRNVVIYLGNSTQAWTITLLVVSNNTVLVGTGSGAAVFLFVWNSSAGAITKQQYCNNMSQSGIAASVGGTVTPGTSVTANNS